MSQNEEDGLKRANLEIDEDTMVVLKQKGDRFYVYVMSSALQTSPDMWGTWLHDMIGIIADAYEQMADQNREEVVMAIVRQLAIEVASERVDDGDSAEQEFN